VKKRLDKREGGDLGLPLLETNSINTCVRGGGSGASCTGKRRGKREEESFLKELSNAPDNRGSRRGGRIQNSKKECRIDGGKVTIPSIPVLNHLVWFWGLGIITILSCKGVSHGGRGWLGEEGNLGGFP